MENKKYFIGLDIGTNSVGYAVTDEDHNLLKFKGEAMWGSHIFDEAKQCAERRGFRTARRRLARRKQRVILVQEIFAREIAKFDEDFFIRLKESAQDKTNKDQFSYFTDKDFHGKYPTIHHLIMDLIEDRSYHDPRLVYMAVAWLVAHRGHFLCEVPKDDVKSILNFDTVYSDLINYADNNELDIYLTEDEDMKNNLKKILLNKVGVTQKKKEMKDILFGGKEEKPNEETFIAQKELITLLAGGQTDTSKLFPGIDAEDKQTVSLSMEEESFVSLLAALEEANAEVLRLMRAIYEWSLLSEVMADKDYISSAKKENYDNHRHDLTDLKYLVRKYLGKAGFRKVFKSAAVGNYVSYSYNLKNLSRNDKNKIKKAKKEDFYTFVKKEILEKITPSDEDKELYDNIRNKIEANTFMPKQVNDNNRVIPYQLYYVELKDILQNVSAYLPFLTKKDKDDLTPTEKLLSIMEFRIPYYVGPLHIDKTSKFAWITKKSGQIRPWNFNELVDLEECETKFIDRMTGTCTYMVGEDVLPKHSLLYEKYTVLNEINKIKINEEPITPEVKQKIYNELFRVRRKVTPKMLEDFMTVNGMKRKNDVLSGIDVECKINSSLSSYHDFKRLLDKKLLTEEQAEQIIKRITYAGDKQRLKKWLEENFSSLSQDDVKYISKLHYKGFGRLSKKFLAEKFACDKEENGQRTSIIEALWNTNCNLMELVNLDRFTFDKELKRHRKEYYATHPATVESVMKEFYISNAVKRPIFRTLDIVKDIEKAMGHAPSKIFVEMARGGGEKNKRTVSRKDQINELYKKVPQNELNQLLSELDKTTNNELQSKKLFLYFMQLGKCMYSGEAINLAGLKSKEYDIDHIFPQCHVKDDSFDNIVLVKSCLNGQKGDSYPIHHEIRSKMAGFWKSLLDKKLISKKKYERLIRQKPFTDAEREGFINRQLVETRQSTKAVAEILRSRYEKQCSDGKLTEEDIPEVVYVKAGLVSDFRHEYDLPKARTINDLHHAKDAYLNIVCGDVYNSRFPDNFIKNRHDEAKAKYSIKTGTVFENEVKIGNRLIWHGKEDVAKVTKTLRKNNIHLTCFAFERKGGLFDQNPLRASAGLLPRKKGLETAKYGGYAKTACSFFMLVAYTECGKKDKRDMMLVPIELMVAERVKKDETFAMRYIEQEIKRIFGDIKEIKDISLPFGRRPVKINTVLSLDGCRYAITKKDGQKVGLVSLMPLLLSKEDEAYIRKIERFIDKNKPKKKNSSSVKNDESDTVFVDSEHDKLTAEQNIELYNRLLDKVSCFPFAKILETQRAVLEAGLNKFVQSDEKTQLTTLSEIIKLFKTKSPAGRFTKSMKLSNVFTKFKEVKIIDTSASGLFESETEDLRSYL